MQYEPQIDGFDIEEAGRVLVNVFAPWVQDLGPSTGRIECDPPAGAAADWQPGAILRMAFFERLCRCRRDPEAWSLTKPEAQLKYRGHSIQLPVIRLCYPEPTMKRVSD